MDFLVDLGWFAARSFLVFLTIAASTAAIVALVRRGSRRMRPHGHLEVRNLNERFERMGAALKAGMAKDRAAAKALAKEEKARRKARSGEGPRPACFVLEFDGDLLATSTASLREEITAILQIAKPGDEVVLKLESGGGAVPHYGLAAAQLVRLRERKVTVTVCIDRVAASGGYMMACVADRIVAAPFSVIGSIGVVMFAPNLRRLLNKHDVDVDELTAGRFKRTLSLFGEVTDEKRAKVQEQLEETHAAFKGFIHAQRPALTVDEVATGEHWLGTRAKALGLVDELGTSDDYLTAKAQAARLFEVRFTEDRAWRERLMGSAAAVLERAALRWWSKASAAGVQ